MIVKTTIALTVFAVLTGCASNTRPLKNSNLYSLENPPPSEWQGRLSVNVQSDPPSSMTAGFLLRGDAKRGELDLYSPLGTTLGALEWTPKSAELVQGNSRQIFHSLDELTQKATGAELPLNAIFGWLRGENIQAAGWQVDLSNAASGTIVAWRSKPLPIVNMRIKLD